VRSVFSYFLVRLTLYFLLFMVLFNLPVPQLETVPHLKRNNKTSESLKVSLERPSVQKRVAVVQKVIKKPEPKPKSKTIAKPKPKKPILKPAKKSKPKRSEPKKMLPAVSKPVVIIQKEPPVEKIAVAAAPSQATVDAINAYESYLRDVIYSKKRYPTKSRRMHQQGSVTMRFIVNKTGEISAFSILKSSGFNTLDKATEKLFERIGTFKPPPREMPTPKELTITIQYTLK